MFRQKLISIVLAATVFTSTLMTVPVSAAGTDTGSVSAPSNIFTDDFNDGNADGWNVYTGNNGGTWTVNNANQFAVSSCNGGKAIANGTSFQDLIYEADVTATSDGSGFLFRVTNVSGGVSDGYNGYFIGLRGSKSLQLGRVTGAAGNTWKELKTQNVPYSNGHLKVVAVGNNIKVYLNNIQYIDYTDNDGSQITSSGAIGLRTWNGAAQFDNIYVRDYYSQTTPAPQYSVPDGVYGTGQTVELTAATTDAAIRYTTDGSMPNSSSPLYTGPLNISDNTEIKSIAVRDGETPSDVTSSLYVLGNESVAVDDDFQDGDKSSYTAYTGNTASPWVGTQTEADGVYTFTQPRGDKAINNSVSVQDFILEGDINPAASGQSSGFVFRVSNPDNGCDDMDGYFAGINNNGYIEICKFASTGTGVWTSIKNVPAVVNANQNNHLKIVGIGQHFWIYLNNVLATEFTDTSYSEGSVGLRAWNDNGTVTYDNLKVYNIKSLKQQAATPVISPAAGVFRNSQEITISCDTPDAKIYYTTDGSKPTTGSQLYNGAFTLSQSATIKAIAVKDGMTDSEVQSSVYTKATSDFSDDFNDNNMDGWKTYDGTWNTSDGSLNVGAGQGYKAVANGLDFSNFTYEADVTLSGGGSTDNAGLIFRVSDPSVGPDSLKGYYAGIRNPATSGVTNDGSVQVGRFNNGWTELASIPYPITSNKAYHLKVEAKGQNIEVYVDGVHVVSVTDNMWKHGTIGVRDWKLNAKFDNISAKDTGDYTDPVYDWSGVKGAVFVPTNAVDEIQEWKFYDHDINDRELSYAHDYGINTVRVFLHYLNWKNDKTNFMNNIEDF
ncbi:MAG TPA: family 16 glycoside hydrolase, partial [Ruminiclostridium sp.]|nr:family 16 glycoside hydrolase [Ruminiclostridium sp.]